MKKFVLLATFLFVINAVFAQEFKQFQFGLGFGGGGNSGGGSAGFYLHPQYNIDDNLTVGLNLQPSILLVVDKSGNAATSFGVVPQLTGAYHFTTNQVRPYAGMAVGLYPFGTETLGSGVNLNAVNIGAKIGLVPNVGVKIGHFKFQIDYQIFPSMPTGINANMLFFKLGFDIGGGRVTNDEE